MSYKEEKPGVEDSHAKMEFDSDSIPLSVPFPVRNESGLFHMIVWKNASENILQCLDRVREYPLLYLPCDGYQRGVEDGTIVYFFNSGLRHCPVKDLVDELYLLSSSYSSLKNEQIIKNRGKTAKHSCLSLLKIVYAITSWMENNTSCLGMVISPQSAKEVANHLIDMLWITEIHNVNRNHIDEYQVRCLPVDKQEDKIFLSDHFVLEIIAELARNIFKIKPLAKSKMEVVCEFFEPLTDFFYWVQNFGQIHKMRDSRKNERINLISNLESLRQLLRNSINWFFNHPNWPEVRWKSNISHSDIWSYTPERCMEIRLSDSETAQQIQKRLELTGTEIYCDTLPKTQPSESGELFSIKPILSSLEWDHDGIHMKIVLNNFLMNKNFFDQLTNVSAKSPLHENLALFREIPIMIRTYLEKLCGLNRKGKVLPKGTLLNNTYFRKHCNGLIFDLCMYGLGNSATCKQYLNKHGYSEGTNDFMRIVHTSMFCDNETESSMLVWEFGVFLINVYQCLLKTSAKSCLNGIESEGRVFLKSFPCSEPFLILIAYIMVLDPTKRPSLEEVLNSDYFNYWIECNELYLTVARQENTHNCLERITRDLGLAPYYLNLPEEYVAYKGEITIDHHLKKYTEQNCVTIINLFSSFIPNKMFHLPLAAKRDLPIVRTTMGDIDKAIGLGPIRDAIEMYCTAVNKMGIFNKSEKKYTNANIWYTLGFLVSHCMMSNIPMNLRLPRHLFKIMLEGPDVDFTLNDLFFEDAELAKNLSKLLFRTNEELQMCDLYWANRMVKGQVTTDNVFLYVKDTVRAHFLKGYDIIDLRALRDGFNVTPSEVPITADILYKTISPEIKYTTEALMSMIRVVPLEASGAHRHHTQNCMKTFSDGRHICFFADSKSKKCPISEFASFISTCDEDDLKRLVYFTTGSSSINTTLFVSVMEVDSRQLPTAATCTTHLFLYAKEEDNNWKKFKRDLLLAIQESAFSYE
jgi:hypothetical protein